MRFKFVHIGGAYELDLDLEVAAARVFIEQLGVAMQKKVPLSLGNNSHVISTDGLVAVFTVEPKKKGEAKAEK